MTSDPGEPSVARNACLAAAGFHAVGAAALVAAGAVCGDAAPWIAAGLLAAAIPPWLHLARLHHAIGRERTLRTTVDARRGAGVVTRHDVFGPPGPEADLALAEQSLLDVRGSAAMKAALGAASIGVIAAAIPAAAAAFPEHAPAFQPDGAGAAVALCAVAALALVPVLRYVRTLCTAPGFGRLRAASGFLAAGTIAAALAGAAVAMRAAGSGSAADVATLVLACGVGALALEILAGAALAFARPRPAGEEPPLPYRSRVVGALAAGEGLGRALRDAFEHQFGFDPSGSRLLAEAARLAPRLGAVAGGSLVLLGCIVVIEPWETGVRLRGGRIAGLAGPGLSAKLPWPLEEIVRVDTGSIRSVHAGSHAPADPGGEVYREGVPILWSNMHGTGDETLLLAAPPADAADGGEPRDRAPTVSLFGADVRVDYRVSAPAEWIRHRSPETLVAHLAGRAATLALARHGIDDLLGAARGAACDEITAAVRAAAGAAGLGVEVVGTSMTGVHPPQPTASSFHDSVAADQERESRIEEARRDATAALSESAGTREAAERLLALLDRAEAGDVSARRQAETAAGDAGGRAAERLAEARSWRWTRAAAEAARAAVFRRELALARIAPRLWREGMVADAVARALGGGRRTVLLARPDEIVVRMPGAAPAAAPAGGTK